MNKNLSIRTVSYLLLASYLGFLLSGCSINMAASGKDNPKIEDIRPGTLKSVVEAQLGKPVNIQKNADGSFVAEYFYEMNDMPDPNRAAAYGALDVMTLGLWELVGTPLEASRTDLKKIKIAFNRQQRVTKVLSLQDTDKPTKDRIAYWANKI